MAPKITFKKLFFVCHFLMEFFGQVRENSGKDHSHPQNFACSYSYVLYHHRFRDFLECFDTVLGIFGVAFVRALGMSESGRQCCHFRCFNFRSDVLREISDV